MRSSKKFSFHELQDNLSSTNIGSETLQEGYGGNLYGTEDWAESADIEYDILSPQLETTLKEISVKIEEKENHMGNEKKSRYGLLNNHGLKRMSSERIIKPTIETPSLEVEIQRFSTEEIMRIAAERFIRSATRLVDVASMLDNPIDLSFSGLSDELTKKLELSELLIASAEKLSNQQYDRAKLLLNECDFLSSSTGNAVERVVHYFSKALRDRIDQETGEKQSQDFTTPQLMFDIDDSIKIPALHNLACYREVPFAQIAHFAGIQTIVENVADATTIHVVDFGIKIGVHWTGLMQTLVSESYSPLQLLKITAVGTNMREVIEDTGKWLTTFAESINLPFVFNIVIVSDMSEVNENLFELDSNETLVVYCEYLLRSLISTPDKLDSMMKVVRTLNPSIMVVTEPEYNASSPVFVTRFVEALFYCSAYFDCLETCMGNDPNRMIIESMYFGEGIKNILVAEGEDRRIRNAKLDVWRLFFARFRMVETRLSSSAFSQAKLIAKTFACGKACTLEMDGKSLLIGWKGTPIHSVSAWKFFNNTN